MPQKRTITAVRPSGWKSLLPPLSVLGFGVAVLAVLVVALFSYQAHVNRTRAADAVSHTLQVIQHIQALQAAVTDAETGQRGYLLTGSESYAQPYETATALIGAELQSLRRLTADSAEHQRLLDQLQQVTSQKLDELNQTMALRRAGNIDAAMAIVRSDRGRGAMQRIRKLTEDMTDEERGNFTLRRSEWEEAITLTLVITWGGAALLLALIAGGAVMTSRDYRQRETEAWLRSGHSGLSQQLQGDLRLDRMGEQVVTFLSQYLGALVGALYVMDGGRYRRVAAYAGAATPEAEVVRPGDGLLGQCAKENQPLLVREVPEGYLTVESSLGRGRPRELLLAPASVDGKVQCVVEFAFFRHVEEADRELLARASESLAMAIRAATDRSRLEELLDETQRQAEELQTQQEELRVNNEELEEQGEALRESQVRLENQQAELEQTNTQLEEQTQQLEQQKEDLSGAQAVLSQRAAELERANQYKSEFLANMSHELRTPLNSTLILAKLLADNKTENLTEQQVKFAQTIASAGNDLLTLINDILDLSKIEAGKVDVNIERVPLARIIEALKSTFEPVARQRALGFSITLDPGVPQWIDTDELRCSQILRNLLSNALKFTEAGEVSLRVSAAPGDRTVSFGVRDTGIGIGEHQRDIIFEAFRQADGSTHRKYGGTGLGLSIARDLARLLGGDIDVQSAAGEGSVFTLTLPQQAAVGRREAPTQTPGQAPSPAPQASIPVATLAPTPPRPAMAGPRIADDRLDLNPSSRMILVVEDDLRFAEILRDLIREQGFQCVLTHNAEDGLSAARTYVPSAILLDMNLPDHSGLGVLDQLKRDPKTRHIPVHVASVADYSHEAMEMGAVGYALKPVKRDELVTALERLEARFSQRLRRVLIVEDDLRQRQSVEQLLASDDVQIVGVASAADALNELKTSTYDCMVLDLNLPDLSGYELLEQMSAQDGVSFPPVIVYTGRSLSGEQETQLRRFSKSIIVKDARSPERLLDEVTLFLHQVEAKLPPERQRMLKAARDRESALEGRRVLVVEDDVRNIFALSAVLEPKGIKVDIARNGIEALDALARRPNEGAPIDLVLMDIMMPEMDGLTAMREIRKRPEWKKLPIIALTAKAMKDDQEKCMAAGANDYIAKPLDVEKLLSLVRVWMPK